MSGLKLLLLGPPQIERDGTPIQVDTRKAIALAAYLAVTGREQRRETLAALFWPDYDQARAGANLRRTLSALNTALGPGWLEADRDTIGLNRAAGYWLDVDAFRQHLSTRRSHDHDLAQVCPACLEPLDQAVSLYRADFMAGFTLKDSSGFDEWQFFQAESLRQELTVALEQIVRCYQELGQLDQALDHCRRWVALDPLHEPAQRRMMLLYALSGQRAAALRQYQACERILSEELGVQPSAETTALWEQIRSQSPKPDEAQAQPSAAGPAAQAPARYQLPSQITPFVGREQELQQIAGRLSQPDCRLLTLVGPGGIGKTRLALQAASDLIERFAHGACFVGLAGLGSAELLLPAIAESLGFRFFAQADTSPKQQLINYLQPRQLLLVVDNLEHLLEQAGLLDDILHGALQVRILATSRERLNLRSEWVVQVGGMCYPENGRSAQLDAYSAVRLFVQNAQRVDAGFSLTQSDGPWVARICRLVEGMPLGLELASSWVRTLSCREIAQEIERSLDFLSGTMRDLPARHRSLRAVFETSWSRLAPEEQAVYARLSVFRGSFDRAAAQQVAGASLSALAALIDHSLLRRLENGRYELHEVLRQYAAEELARRPEEAVAARERHCAAFCGLLCEQGGSLRAGDQVAALEVIAQDLQNIRAGFDWAVSQGRVAELNQCTDCLFFFFEIRSLLEDGEQSARRALATLSKLPGEPQGERAVLLGRLLVWRANFARRLGQFAEARELARQGLPLVARHGGQLDVALFSMIAFGAGVNRDDQEAWRLLEDSLAIFSGQGSLWGVALCLINKAHLTWGEGDTEAARQLYEQGLALRREIGDEWGVAATLLNLGELAHHTGRFEAARHHYRESLELARKLGDRWATHLCLDYLGYVTRRLGGYEEARRLHQESRAIAEEIGDLPGVAGALDNLGLVALDTGDVVQARDLLERGLAIRRRLDLGGQTELSKAHLAQLELLEGNLEAALALVEASLTYHQQHGWEWEVPSELELKSRILAAQGKLEPAQVCLCDALMTAQVIGAITQVTSALAELAVLSARQGEPEQAAVLSALVAAHPAADRRARDRAQYALLEATSLLPDEALQLARQRGERADLAQVVGEAIARSICCDPGRKQDHRLPEGPAANSAG